VVSLIQRIEEQSIVGGNGGDDDGDRATMKEV
jgi:hypothetical protein